MNLQTHIKSELWAAISSTYESKNYTHAINDAMHYLSDFLREKSGADGDGSNLVGQALGGDNPKLRINKFQTESEKSEQKGYLQILLGLYQGIRNPRSHEQVQDDQQSADSIIYFINYLLMVIDKSQPVFTVQHFVDYAFDPDFVETEHYAKLIIDEVPFKKRLETLIQLYRRKEEGDAEKLKYIIYAFIDVLSKNELDQFLVVVSDELRTTTEGRTIENILTVLPPQYWREISEVARLRIENKVLLSIPYAEAMSRPHGMSFYSNANLVQLAKPFLPYFADKDTILSELISKLYYNSSTHSDFFAYYYQSQIIELIGENRELIEAYATALIYAFESRQKTVLEYFSLRKFPAEVQQRFVGVFGDKLDRHGSFEREFLSTIGELPF